MRPHFISYLTSAALQFHHRFSPLKGGDYSYRTPIDKACLKTKHT
jgi:hypothetical protein